jgi:hypothetical protein
MHIEDAQHHAHTASLAAAEDDRRSGAYSIPSGAEWIEDRAEWCPVCRCWHDDAGDCDPKEQ